MGAEGWSAEAEAVLSRPTSDRAARNSERKRCDGAKYCRKGRRPRLKKCLGMVGDRSAMERRFWVGRVRLWGLFRLRQTLTT
jgi:hypothetical protein